MFTYIFFKQISVMKVMKMLHPFFNKLHLGGISLSISHIAQFIDRKLIKFIAMNFEEMSVVLIYHKFTMVFKVYS